MKPDVNEILKKKEINETESWFFEKINKTDKPRARLTWEKGERERDQLPVLV